MKTLAVVGAGNWGLNHIRTLYNSNKCKLKWVIDSDEKRLGYVAEQFSSNFEANGSDIHTQTYIDHMLSDQEVQGVIIATPSHTHFEVAKLCLEAGKDVLVEKPLSHSSEDAAALVELAKSKERLLMVGHLLVFHPALRRVKDYITRGTLGDVLYMYSQRLNLGVIRADEDCLWSLAPHDLSMVIYLLGENVIGMDVNGQSYVQHNKVDVAFISLRYPNKKMAHIHVSWLDPHKTRKLTIVGTRKMLVFDDMETTEKLKLYDKGIEKFTYDSYGESLNLRFGDIRIPNFKIQEPLKVELEHFLHCMHTRQKPITSGESGLVIIKLLEQATKLLYQKQI